MMAYENNNANNAPFMNCYDQFGSYNMEGKLASSNMIQMSQHNQQGFTCSSQQQQMNNAFNFQQMSLRSQANLNSFNNNNNNNMISMGNMNHMQPAPMSMNGYQQPTLMNSMMMMQQQPRMQNNNFQQQQQQPKGIPNFISFQNDSSNMNMMTSKQLDTIFEPLNIPSVIDTSKPLLGNLEPLPVLEKSEPSTVDAFNGSSSSMAYDPRGNICKSKRLLPPDFQPNGTYVICGNKRKYFESKGNIRFREVCKMFLQEYVQAPTKIEKSGVVTKVMNILREDCPEGAFISPQGGRWYAVSERTAREKVGTFFRDCLADSYKSSAKNKIARRKVIKNAASANNSARSNRESNDKSDDGSLGSISFYDVDDLTPVPL